MSKATDYAKKALLGAYVVTLVVLFGNMIRFVL